MNRTTQAACLSTGGRALQRAAMTVLIGLFLMTATAPAQFGVRLIDVAGNTVDNTTEALDIAANLGSTAEPYLIQSDITELYSVVDLVGGGGTFGVNNPYPGGTTAPGNGDDFVGIAMANVTIPAGRWQIGFGSDDGGALTLAGTSITPAVNENGAIVAGDDTILFEAPRGHAWTHGVINLTEPLTTTLTVTFFERGGGDSLEVAIRNASAGLSGTVDPAGGWVLLENGVEGWSVSTDKTRGRRVAGDMLIGSETLTDSSVANQVFGDPIDVEGGLRAERFNGNLSSLGAWNSFLSGDPLPVSSGIINEINWGHDGNSVGAVGYPAALGFPSPSNQDNYSVRVRGEILIDADGAIQFKDGNDDYTYLAIDLDGNGAIDGGSEVLIDDNNWTNPQGTENGGSPIVVGNFMNVAAGGEFRTIEFRMAEGGGGDSGVLYWDQNDGAPAFPATQTTAADPAHLIPSEAFRVTFSELESADRVFSLAGDTDLPAIFDIHADVLAADQIGLPSNPAPDLFNQVLDVDGAPIFVKLNNGTLDPGDTFTLLNMTNIDSVVGTASFSFSHGGIWDVSRFNTTGQITFVQIPEPHSAVLAGLGVLGLAGLLRRRRR